MGGYVRRARTSANRHTCSNSLLVVVIQISTGRESVDFSFSSFLFVLRGGRHTVRITGTELIPRRTKHVHLDIMTGPLIIEEFFEFVDELTASVIALSRGK